MTVMQASPDPLAFLAGAGEMAQRLREFGWATTSIGDPAGWPQSLKTAVRIMLTSRQPIWIGWGSDLLKLYNDPYKAIIGGKHPRMLGCPAAEVWREIWSEIGPMLATAMKGDEGTYVEEQLLIMERNGYPEETYYTFSYSPIPSGDGGVGGIICANTDDTERVVNRRRLGLLREMTAKTSGARSAPHACELAALGLASAPRDLPFCLLYLGRSDGKLLLAGSCGLDRGRWIAPASFALDDPKPWLVEQRLRPGEPSVVNSLPAQISERLPTGAWDKPPSQIAVCPFEVTSEAGWCGVLVAGLNPFRPYDDGTRDFLALVVCQITTAIANGAAFDGERRRAEALAELDRAKTQFFSNVSHEFRTPLTLQLGAIETLLKERARLAPAQIRELDMAHRNGLRLLKLVNTLLDFSRIEAGRMQATFEPIEVSAFTAELASNFRSACAKARLNLDIDCPNLSEPVWIDRDLWEKIVLNLLSNAFKFTFEGGIRVEVRRRDQQVELNVSDTGTGIPAHDIPHIFERFHRVEGARGRSHEGSGIGLALVQELVRLHGGKIAVESHPNVGSTFCVTLPLGNAHLAQDRVGARGIRDSTSLRAEIWLGEAMSWLPDASALDLGLAQDVGYVPAIAQAADHQFRVLVADDNLDMRDYLVRLLSPYWHVEAVRDGAMALAAAKARPPDLVLSDVMMPKLDGFGLLRAIRADPALKVTPVILLSARAGEEAQAEGLEAGADDYLVKPFTARELVVRIGSALHMARVRRESAEVVLARTRELEAVLDTVPAGVWFTFSSDTDRATSNRRGADMLGLPRDKNFSLTSAEGERPSWRVLRNGAEIDPKSLPLQRAARGERVDDEELEVELKNGQRLTLLTSAASIRQADGRISGAVAAAVDITERKRLEQRQRLLLNELAHRGKNLLAIIQSIAMRTLVDTADVRFARPAFLERLHSLSRSYEALTLGSFEGAPMATIVMGELGAFAAQAQVAGPDLSLNDKAAQTMALLVHELATNASKHGAWSESEGTVAIRWNIDANGAEPRVTFAWVEHGGPPAEPPASRGFGTTLMRQVVAMEFDAEPDLSYTNKGFRYEFSAPIVKILMGAATLSSRRTA